MILAAGYATRLYPLTLTQPKPILPVAGKSILDWLVDDIAPLTDEFAVISNHKFADRFRQWAAGKPRPLCGSEGNSVRHVPRGESAGGAQKNGGHHDG